MSGAHRRLDLSLPKTRIAAIVTAERFGGLFRAEALRRGIAKARVVVVLIGDGAVWVWKLARINSPNAICILVITIPVCSCVEMENYPS